jgi:hypothetical protein
MKAKKIDWIIAIIFLTIAYILAFYYMDKTPDPVEPAVEAVMTPHERAERACEGSKFYESCVEQALKNIKENQQ